MGEKDISEKLLLDYDDVFADIVNVLLYDGEEIVRPGELERANTISQYKADNSKPHEEERDVAKYWKRRGKRVLVLGIENQTDADADMTLRVSGYDGAAYRKQILDKNGRFPVVSMVLYYGWKKHWGAKVALKERIPVPKKLDPYVNDCKINVFEIAWLSDEQISKFKSDFRIVADFFVQKRKTGKYVPSNQEMKHVDEMLKFLAVFNGDDNYLKIQVNKKEPVSMCEVLESYKKAGVEEGRELGREEGRELGREEGRQKTIGEYVKTCLKKGMLRDDVIMHVVEFFAVDEAKACEIVEKNWN